MLSINIGIMSVQEYINSMWRQWNSTAIKHMRKQLKPAPFSLPIWAWVNSVYTGSVTYHFEVLMWGDIQMLP